MQYAHQYFLPTRCHPFGPCHDPRDAVLWFSDDSGAEGGIVNPLFQGTIKMKSVLSLMSLLLLSSVCYGAAPTVDSIDYSNPQKYLAIPDSLGDQKAIMGQALKLKSGSDLDTFRNVLTWMEQNLKYDEKIAYKWRNYDDVVRDKCYGGCADYGIVCGVLLKGANIPVVWVKTMDVAWIWDFKKGRSPKSWSGHVFLEVFVNGKWSL